MEQVDGLTIAGPKRPENQVLRLQNLAPSSGEFPTSVQLVTMTSPSEVAR